MPTRPDHPAPSGTVAEAPAPPAPEPIPAFYDRSSLPGDYLVMIAGQTEEDYFRLAPEKRFCEYIDGIVYMPSPVNTRHQELVQFLFYLLESFRWERGRGRVLTGPAVLQVAPGRDLEPDIFVQPVDAPMPPDGIRNRLALLVIEILSSHRSHDLETKARVYREAGIPEIWYVDPRDRVLHVDRRAGDGGYESLRLDAGILPSTALPGFWIDVAWLWADPLPNPRRCLDAILAGPPA